MNLDNLEEQVLIWNRAAVSIPIIFTLIIVVFYCTAIFSLTTLVFIACGLYFITAVVWWWWTMKSIHLLVHVLKGTKQGVTEVAIELRNIRNELLAETNNTK